LVILADEQRRIGTRIQSPPLTRTGGIIKKRGGEEILKVRLPN